jgi:putative ABC transport system ATP-binding protein
VARTIDAVKVYGKGQTEVRALDGISVEIAGRHLTAIMGPSGSGKSTLMHCLAGLDDLTSGQAFIGDVDLGSLSDRERTLIRRDRVGFVFQTFNLLPTLTAMENITLPLDLAGRKPDREWVDTVIGTLRLGDRLTHRPSELSGGQQQRVAVARALASRPDIIFADEPSRRATSTPGPVRSCWGSCAGPWTSWGRPSSWSPTTPWPRVMRTRCSSWPTAASSDAWSTRPPRRCSTA